MPPGGRWARAITPDPCGETDPDGQDHEAAAVLDGGSHAPERRRAETRESDATTEREGDRQSEQPNEAPAEAGDE